MTIADVLQIDDVLAATTLEQILKEMRAAEGEAATVLGATPQQRVTATARKATQVGVRETTYGAVLRLLEAVRPRIEAHFGRFLDGFEEPQFLRYRTGDYFVAHQDGNTPLVHDESRFRKITVVVSLSAQSREPRPGTFGGGELVIHGPVGQAGQRLTLAPAPGTLVAFPAETTHEVLPITHGERLSIVSWYRG